MALSDKPIGIFDSGLGGLTVVKAVLENMPNENIIYLGDSLNVPYGDKTSGQITEFAFNNTKFLLSKGVKAIAIRQMPPHEERSCNALISLLSELSLLPAKERQGLQKIKK